MVLEDETKKGKKVDFCLYTSMGLSGIIIIIIIITSNRALRVVHKMFLPFFSFLFYPSMPKSGKLLKLDQGRDLGYKNQ